MTNSVVSHVLIPSSVLGHW